MSTADILTSPIVNGTPSGSGTSIIYQKFGTGLANYTSASSATIQDVDATNLSVAVVVPVGWKAKLDFSCSSVTSANTSTLYLYDGATRLIETINQSTLFVPTSIRYVVTGDGKTHSFIVRYVSGVGWTYSIINDTPTRRPVFTVELVPCR